jgi:hypothetical protein
MIRRRHNISSTSSSDLSPTIPVLESPVSFQALTPQSISEATLKQNKLNRTPVKPSMFFEEREEDEDGVVPNLTSVDPKDGRSARAVHKGCADERLLSRTKSQFFEDSFRNRNPWISPSTRMSQDSLVVIEIKMNIKVSNGSHPYPKYSKMLGTDFGLRSKTKTRSSLASLQRWHKFTRDLSRSWWSPSSKVRVFSLVTWRFLHTR